jgi:hypothetical protein
METFLGKDHIDYKKYIEQFNIVIDAIDEIAFLSNTLDYERLVVFFKEVVEIFEFFKNIDENDDNSEGFSNMTNKDDLFLSIIDSNEYNNLIKFMETYRETIIRKSDNLKEKITGLLEFKSLVNPSSPDETPPNQYIKVVYNGNVELIQAKMKDISDKLKKNIDDKLPVIDEKKVKFDIKLITKNDMICILSSYRLLKMLVYKQMHVIDREYYTATKEDVLEFRKELYDIYTMLCEHFNREKNLYVEDIHTKFLEVVEGARDLEKYGDIPANATEGAMEATKGAVEATEGAMEATKGAVEATVGAKEEIDTNIVDEDTGDNGVMDKKLKELDAEYQDEKNRKKIAMKIAIKTQPAPAPPVAPAPAPPVAPKGALGLEDFISTNPLEARKAQVEAELKAELKAKTDAVIAAKENAQAKLKAGKEQGEAFLNDLKDPQKILTSFFK